MISAPRPEPTARATRARAALVAAWLAATALGFAVLLRYHATPEARAGEVRLAWPSESRLIARTPGRMTVLVFLHPKCPCSSATLDELDSILGRVAATADVRAVFVAPPGAPAGWTATGLRDRASRMAGLRIEDDADGVEARIFGATTSGTTFVYDRDGRLVFRGGVTRSRGHAGDNPGRRAVLALATGETPEAERTPVFGCPLAGDDAAPAETSR
jgi:hypothetical protein